MRFGNAVAFAYRESWAFVRRGWWLALVPPLPFLAYVLSVNTMPQIQTEPAWWWLANGLGAVLQAALAYPVIRFIALRHDFAAAIAVNPDSARTFAPYLAAMSVLNITLMSISNHTGPWTWVGMMALGLVVSVLLSAWSVTAPSGATVMGPIRSIRLVGPHLPWALIFQILALLPVVLLQGAGLVLVLRLSPALVIQGWPVADALLTAYANLLELVALFVIAHRAGVRVSEDRRLAAVFD